MHPDLSAPPPLAEVLPRTGHPPNTRQRFATIAEQTGLWARAVARAAVLQAAPRGAGPRDHQLHLDRVPYRPPSPMSRFLRATLERAGLAHRAPEVARHLRANLPGQSLWGLGKVMLELSWQPTPLSLGILMMGSCRRLTAHFLDYLRAEGLDAQSRRLIQALCAAFPVSSLTLVRVEFSEHGPPRYSIFPGWFHDFWRGHHGFERVIGGVDRSACPPALLAHLSGLTRLQAPDLYPFCIGVSVRRGAAPELKAYTVRYDADHDVMDPGSGLYNLIAALELSEPALQEVLACHRRLWAASQDKFIQVCTEISAAHPRPERLSLIYCGTHLAPLLSHPPAAAGAALRDGVRLFRETFPADQAQFLGVRVGPDGLSSRVKLYGHALFDLDDLRALG